MIANAVDKGLEQVPFLKKANDMGIYLFIYVAMVSNAHHIKFVGILFQKHLLSTIISTQFEFSILLFMENRHGQPSDVRGSPRGRGHPLT